MKVIFLNRYFFPDHSATSQMLSDLAFHLADEGNEVHVICSRQLYESADAQLPSFDTTQGVKIHRVWTSRFGRASLPGRASDYFSFYWSAVLKLLSLSDTQTIVVAKTDPPLISIPAAWAVRWRGACLVNWLQDVFPEVASELGIKVLKGKFGALVCRLRNASLRAASMNVVIGERMADKVKRLGIDVKKVSVIHNWADGTAIFPVAMENNQLRKQWGLEGKFVIGYSGNMGRAHDFDTLLGAAELLRDNQRICFLMIGAGKQREYVLDEVNRRGLDNVVFRPYQPREMLAQSLGLPDIHVVSLLPQLEGLIMPSKLYGILAAGRPSIFVGAKDGEVAQLLSEESCGVSVGVGEAERFAETALTLSGEPGRISAMGMQARRVFDSRFDKKALLAMWCAMLKEI